VNETLVLQERPAKPCEQWDRGFQSPSSSLWSLATFLVNLALIMAATDLVYRAKTFLHLAMIYLLLELGYGFTHGSK